MASASEMESKMTIFYSKSTKEIKYVSTGIQDFAYFGTDENDFSQIWDYIIINRDDYIIGNFDNFVVEDGEIKLKVEKTQIQYSLASS